MNIGVVGTGYVGSVTGAVFADFGNEVVCVDNLPDKVAARNVSNGRRPFTTGLALAVVAPSPSSSPSAPPRARTAGPVLPA